MKFEIIGLSEVYSILFWLYLAYEANTLLVTAKLSFLKSGTNEVPTLYLTIIS